MPNKSINLPSERKSQLRKYVLEELESSAKKESAVKPKVEAPKEKATLPTSPKAVQNWSQPPKAPRKNFIGAILALILVIIILALAVDIFGLYRLSWHDGASETVARILFLPAGGVNGKTIGLADYLDDLNLLETALKQGREGVNGNLTIGKNDAEKIFNRLAAIKLIDLKLAEFKKSVTGAELEQSLNSLISQIGSRTEAEKSIQKLYGLNLNQFKLKVLRPVLAREKLQAVIIAKDDLAINQEAKAKAQEALELALKPMVNFAALASQFTEDEAGINTGGEMGWISKGELPSEIEQALFATNSGKVYNQIIKNKTGYHILKVENKLIDPDTGKESVKARQILIKVDVDKYIKSLMDSAKIKRYIKI